MKVITWNCNMAFRKKAEHILRYKPDLLIVPECEHPDKLQFSDMVPAPADMLWFGHNLHKGLGIFSYSHYRLKLRRTHNPAFKLIVPIAVTGGNMDFDLYAVWANHPGDPDGQYVEQVWKALQHYDKKLNNRSVLLTGDFNSNTIWDRKSREGNHSQVVECLARKGIISCYHHHHQQVQGSEKDPTFYLYRHADKPYHLDYCFVSADFAKRIQSVETGSHADWMRHSDHVPLMVTFGE
jgi:exodeoxyribonuclease III